MAVRVVDNNPASRRSHVSAIGYISAESLANKFSLMARIRLNCAKKIAHSAGYSVRTGHGFKSRLDHQSVLRFSYLTGMSNGQPLRSHGAPLLRRPGQRRIATKG